MRWRLAALAIGAMLGLVLLLEVYAVVVWWYF